MGDLLDGLVQYPGGWVADRFGRRTGLWIFIGLAIAGYILLLLGRSWETAMVALVLVMAWSSMASPTLFAVIGDALPPERRAVGFSVQSILRRVPIAIAPAAATLGLVSLIQLPLLRPPVSTSHHRASAPARSACIIW